MTWELDKFEGVVPTMAARLNDGPMSIDALASELSDGFGGSPASVSIMAGTHPAFLAESGEVMLRPADRPHVLATDLESTRQCYLVDGVWSWRVPVDHDVLRGSGRGMPQAFAVHLGGKLLESGSISSPVGPIRLGWSQNASIGSLRAAARSLEAEEGDWLFVRRVSTSSVDFQLVRATNIPTGPAGALKALVGAPGSNDDVEQVLADALGLRGTVNHDLTEERDVLVARRENDLVELIDEL